MTSVAAWTARLGSRTLVLATLLMTVLLIGLALLQYRWVGQVSQAERDRLARALRTSADRITDDFDREVFRAFVAFSPHRERDERLADRLADGWERWRATALEPEMVAAVYVIDPDRDEASGVAGLEELDPGTRELRAAEWPPELAALEQRFAAIGSHSGPSRARGPFSPVLPSAPALVIPIWVLPRERQPSSPPPEPSFVVVLLDRRVLANDVLPALVDLHLGPEPRETQAWVLDRTRQGEILYATAPDLAPPARRESGAAARTLLDLRSFPELRAQGFQPFFDDSDARRELGDPFRYLAPSRSPMPGRPPSGGGRNAPRVFRSRPGGPDQSQAWALVLAPVEGSLDAAVARLRRRNLGVGLAVVGLLGATAGLLLLSARQMQRLTRRELELVAGITHELRTPLAAIGSAADNLADGIVEEPAQVRRYGNLIRGETHRLGTLVAQVLDFAGTAAMLERSRQLEPVDVRALVERVLSDHRWSIEEKGFTVELPSDGERPIASAEPQALRRALDNVIGNALKYAESGRWLKVEIAYVAGGDARRGRRQAGGPRIEVRVRDRGPGIPRAERRRVFEPFYRGEGSVAPHLHGTGLGLAVTKSVLESFGGTIEIEDSEAGRGATFLLTLPAAPPEPSEPTALEVEQSGPSRPTA